LFVRLGNIIVGRLGNTTVGSGNTKYCLMFIGHGAVFMRLLLLNLYRVYSILLLFTWFPKY